MGEIEWLEFSLLEPNSPNDMSMVKVSRPTRTPDLSGDFRPEIGLQGLARLDPTSNFQGPIRRGRTYFTLGLVFPGGRQSSFRYVW